jgi:hypothetical protein
VTQLIKGAAVDPYDDEDLMWFIRHRVRYIRRAARR